jgi:hypothetical protein
MRRILFALFVLCSITVSGQTVANNSGPLALVSNIKVASYKPAPTFTIAQILALPKLVPKPPAVKITGFTMSIAKFNGDQLGPFIAKGADMTPEMINALTAVKGRSGTIYFDDIKATGPDGRNRPLHTITIKYTN